jgi:hypothetical protein
MSILAAMSISAVILVVAVLMIDILVWALKPSNLRPLC